MDTNPFVTLVTFAVLSAFYCLLPYIIVGGRKD